MLLSIHTLTASRHNGDRHKTFDIKPTTAKLAELLKGNFASRRENINIVDSRFGRGIPIAFKGRPSECKYGSTRHCWKVQSEIQRCCSQLRSRRRRRRAGADNRVWAAEEGTTPDRATGRVVEVRASSPKGGSIQHIK